MICDELNFNRCAPINRFSMLYTAHGSAIKTFTDIWKQYTNRCCTIFFHWHSVYCSLNCLSFQKSIANVFVVQFTFTIHRSKQMKSDVVSLSFPPNLPHINLNVDVVVETIFIPADIVVSLVSEWVWYETCADCKIKGNSLNWRFNRIITLCTVLFEKPKSKA